MADFCKKCAPKAGMKFEPYYPFLCEQCGETFHKLTLWQRIRTLLKL